jgi:hypothetical protein
MHTQDPGDSTSSSCCCSSREIDAAGRGAVRRQKRNPLTSRIIWECGDGAPDVFNGEQEARLWTFVRCEVDRWSRHCTFGYRSTCRRALASASDANIGDVY